jgi:hypothetical protein
MPPDMNIGPQTTFREIQQNFGNLDPKLDNRHLRKDESRGLHLHDTGKWSGIGANAAALRQNKYEAAFNTVCMSIDRQLGGGEGQKLLLNVLGQEKYQNSLIEVRDLNRIGLELERIKNARLEAELNVAKKA